MMENFYDERSPVDWYSIPYAQIQSCKAEAEAEPQIKKPGGILHKKSVPSFF
jgi:hypothetical protein